MIRIAEMEAHLKMGVQGQYLLTHVEERTTQGGDRYKVLTLEDCSGALVAYAWERTGLLEAVPLQVPVAVAATLHPRRFNNRMIADLAQIYPLEQHEVANAAALLPQRTCPDDARPALQTLVERVDALDVPHLQGFMNRLLQDPRITATLTTCKGSQTHHHNAAGGLLVHSVEVMQIAEDMARTRLDARECAIVQVAAFLHDLGKLCAVGSGSVRPIHYKLASHETQTLRLLDPHLLWLQVRNPEVAAGLEYILNFLVHPAANREHALFVGADIVAYADRLSAALQNKRRLGDLLNKTQPARSVQPAKVARSCQPSSFRHGGVRKVG